jgi:predicted murein hydrolase (TIGR00659 family)
VIGGNKVKEIILNSAYFGIALSIFIYFISIKIRSKTKLEFINPLLITIILLIVFLLSFKIDYETYNSSAKYLSYLLTPATVCLAIPLYKQLSLLKKNIKAVIIGISVGVITSLGSIFLMSYLLGLTHEQYVSLLPKSVTTAIGVGISEELGGIPSITIAAIVLTGNLGNLLAVWVCKLFKIKEPIAVGLAIGTSSHALGTTKALEIGEAEGAMSSLSIAVAGLLTVVFTSVFAMLM